MKTKQEIINELSRLYTLQEEGKNIRHLINTLEEELCELCDDELDAEKVDEKDKAKR